MQALQAGSVTLDPGSGLEDAYQRKTSFSMQSLQSLEHEHVGTSSSPGPTLIYAGNKRPFHLQADIGRTPADRLHGCHAQPQPLLLGLGRRFRPRAHSQRTTCSCTSTLPPRKMQRPQALSPPCCLPSAGVRPATRLDAPCMSSPQMPRKARRSLQVTIPVSACSAVQANPYDGRKPLTTDTALDAANWGRLCLRRRRPQRLAPAPQRSVLRRRRHPPQGLRRLGRTQPGRQRRHPSEPCQSR